MLSFTSMARLSPPVRSERPRLAAGASWLALVAATALGGQLDTLETRISCDQSLAEEAAGYRLVVQSYARCHLDSEGAPAAGARPLSSSQRAVTPAELREGVDVRVLQLDAGQRARDSVVLAWVERGAPDLEFDALRARPTSEAVVGDSNALGALRVVVRSQA